MSRRGRKCVNYEVQVARQPLAPTKKRERTKSAAERSGNPIRKWQVWEMCDECDIRVGRSSRRNGISGWGFNFWPWLMSSVPPSWCGAVGLASYTDRSSCCTRIRRVPALPVCVIDMCGLPADITHIHGHCYSTLESHTIAFYRTYFYNFYQ